MAAVAVVISGLSLVIAAIALVRNERRWRDERRGDVRVQAWHDGSGMDIYGGGRIEVEDVIAVRIINLGERSEHVMWAGLEKTSGEPLADDRNRAKKIVDDPPPTARELPPRGQIAIQFKASHDSLTGGFVGYAMLATGSRVYSMPAMPDMELGKLQAELTEGIHDT
jgi:hypothetical protein